jgi:hypothetical protein
LNRTGYVNDGAQKPEGDIDKNQQIGNTAGSPFAYQATVYTQVI